MNIDNLKMKDLAEVEELTGANMDEWEHSSKAKLTMAIAYVLGKKSDPELTWEKVQDMSVDEISQITDAQIPKVNIS